MRSIVAFRADDDLLRALQQEARQRAITVSECIRDALDHQIRGANIVPPDVRPSTRGAGTG